MSKVCYVGREVKPDTLRLFREIEAVVDEYRQLGIKPTLEQTRLRLREEGCDRYVHCQSTFNTLIREALLAGYLDWESLRDTTTAVSQPVTGTGVAAAIDQCAQDFHIDKWAEQPNYVECWINDYSTHQLMRSMCDEEGIVCRNFTVKPSILSLHEAWNSDIRPRLEAGKPAIVLYVADLSPFSLESESNIATQMSVFSQRSPYLRVERVALTKNLVDAYNLPGEEIRPTGRQTVDYIRRHGKLAWQLAQLRPTVLIDLVRQEVIRYRDDEQWQRDLRRERDLQDQIRSLLKSPGGHVLTGRGTG